MIGKKIKRISVITVCLNARDSIRLTLESVACQTFADIEHVIIDGGSKDETCDIVKEYSVGYFESQKDEGVYYAMQKGAQAATGDILFFLNAGDTFYDVRTCEDIAAFFEETNADIVFGNILPVYLKASDKHDHGAFTPGKAVDLSYIINRRQLYQESIHHQSTFYKKWIFKYCSFICPFTAANGEYNILLNAVMKHNARVKHIPRIVSKFALGGISTRNFEEEWAKYVKARDILRQMYCPDPEAIKVQNEYEFLHKSKSSWGYKKNKKNFLKQMIKKTILFRIYERIVFSFSARTMNMLIHRVENMQETQTQRLFNDLNFVFKKNQETSYEEFKQSIISFEKTTNGLQKQIKSVENLMEIHFANFHNILQENIQGFAKSFENVNMRFENLNRLISQTHVNLSIKLDKPSHSDQFTANGYQVFSQWDEDGLIQYIISNISYINPSFVEFGVGDYSEANTRFLLQKNNWRGFIIDSNIQNIEKIRNSEIYWRYSLNAISAFVNRENINNLLLENNITGEIGLLSIDIDGMDYWVWDAITAISAQIVILEYNGIFGSKAKVAVPYDPKFDRTQAHFSWLYSGAALSALIHLGHLKGYTLVGTNMGGNNAFFIRDDVLKNSSIKPSSCPYTRPMFRESRNPDGSLSYLDIADSIALIQDMEVFDIEQEKIIKIGEITLCYN